jgi:hypothetical protein
MKLLLALLVLAAGFLYLAGPAGAGEKKVVGWVEKIRIDPGGVVLSAKLDSGAEYSSLDARNITFFRRDGANWVRFDLDTHQGKSVTLERRVIRRATIKRHFAGSQKRPVISLGVCLGSFYQETEVNLVDRSGFQYPMLIGRKFMAGALLIDPSRKYTVEPNCGEQNPLE